MYSFFFSSRRRHTRCGRDWSSDVCSSDLKKSDVTYQQPDQEILMASHKEYCCNSAETCCGAHRADQKQSLAADSINDRHGEHGKYQVRGADRHGLKVGRNLVKTRVRED